MRCTLTGAKEGPGCDEAAAAAAGTSGDCGGGAPPPATSPTPSTSGTSSASPPSEPTPSPPPAPTPSSSSPSPPQSPRPTPSSPSSADEEIAWGDEQEVDQLEESFGSTHLSSTYSDSEEFCHIFGSAGYPIFSNSKLGDEEPVLTLLEDSENDTIIGKIMLLDEKYGSRRRTAGDGSCFYRAFIFKYLENVVEMKDEDERKTEAARLRRRVESYMPVCHDVQLLHSFSGFESVVNLVEQGLVNGELYQMDMNEDVISRILPLLRALTEIEICTNPGLYHAFLIPGESYESVFELCLREVRPLNAEANNMQVFALAKALGVPVILENLDVNDPGKLNPLYIYPPLESEAEAPMAQVEHDGPKNLSPAEQRRLVTLLYRPGHYDIIYPK